MIIVNAVSSRGGRGGGGTVGSFRQSCFVKVIGTTPRELSASERQELAFVLPKESGVVAEISIPDGGKAAGAAVLRVAGRIRQRHFHIQTLQIRVANANVTRIEVMVFKQVEESIRKHNVYDERIRFRLGLLLLLLL